MDIKHFKDMTRHTVTEPMLSFIKEWGADGYSRRDVKRCERLIFKYLKAIGSMKSPANSEIMEKVRELVLALNDLNEATEYSLLETEEREALWEIIQTSAVAAGLTDAPEDITEEWREW